MNLKRLILATVSVLFLFAASGIFAQGLSVSGILDSSVNMRSGAGEASAFSYGLEEYANLRAQARIRDRAVFYGALNFIAAAGNPAKAASGWGLYRDGGWNGLSPSSYVEGENYISGIELERLYFRLNGDYLDFEGGLLRLPFGYGQIWGPSDFLNPRNPLYPEARPRAVLGAGLSWYPRDSVKLLFFGAAPKTPLLETGAGGLGGISLDRHGDKTSFQLLYAFQSPHQGADQGIHRTGLSVKADLVLGLVADMLYTWNREEGTGFEGLSASAGFDYTFPGGRFYVLAEYLSNGGASATSVKGGNLTGFSNGNCLYASVRYRINDYTSASAALVSGFNDV
ncbi:MAG: hypothetical protein LBJ24_04125, partial [Treponema sp.]|nr:hypothetical protein [Treponema sp.]